MNETGSEGLNGTPNIMIVDEPFDDKYELSQRTNSNKDQEENDMETNRRCLKETEP